MEQGRLEASAQTGAEEQDLSPSPRDDLARENWTGVSIEQRSPNGQNIIGQILFYVCPRCRAMVPSDEDQHGANFVDGHIDWHRRLDDG